jgi:predicted amidohydrolase YtcJ
MDPTMAPPPPQQPPPPPQDLVLTGGDVLTGDHTRTASAIWLHDGKVAAVGTDDEVLAAAGNDAQRVELAGATVIPGLVDTHPHLMHFSAFFGATLDITDVKNHAEIVDRIRERAAATPVGEWIATTPVGEPHYFLQRSWRDLEEAALPTREVLDQAAPDHPVIIQAWAPVLPNAVACNSAALARLGIDESTPDRVENVWIEKDATGRPTGILTGSVTTYYNDDPYFAQLAAQMPPLIQEDVIPGAHQAAMARYQSLGITSIFEAHEMDVTQVEAYKFLHSMGWLGLRVMVSHALEINSIPAPPKTMDDIEATLQHALADRKVDDDWFRVDTITVCAFGPASCGRMYWKSGYKDSWGGTAYGVRQTSAEKVQYAIDWCLKNDLRLNVMIAAPDEHDEYLTWLPEAMERNGVESVDWMIQHGIMMKQEQAHKFGDLGFDITVSAGFTAGKGDMIASRVGEYALEWLNPLRDFHDAGMAVAASTDWGPVNPFMQMWMSLTHPMYPSGKTNVGRAQKINRQEAFDMWTRGGAEVLRWPGIGSLEPGSYADVVIVDRNPVSCDVDDLPQTKVLGTVLGGRVVFDGGAFAGQG